MWPNYLMGIKFLLLTYNSGVKHLFSQQDINVRQTRLLAFLIEFNFKLRHIKGKTNKVADQLSRRTNGHHELIISKVKNDIENRIKYARRNDENYIKTREQLQGKEENLHKTDLNIDKNGVLRFKDRLYVPNATELKTIILDELHKNPYFRHSGYQKMIAALRK